MVAFTFLILIHDKSSTDYTPFTVFRLPETLVPTTERLSSQPSAHLFFPVLQLLQYAAAADAFGHIMGNQNTHQILGLPCQFRC